ncbi:MAG: hypothetical protein EOO22_22365 [Comamonadaceae bacterium]|nr:MAG: hypothetical protein EOO22_22365 [Comamonadaceae bacterium]
MTSQTLSAVALHVVDQYGSAGKHLNQAYRTGVERLVGGANARYATFLQNRSIPLVNEQVKADLINAQQLLAGFLLKGVHAGSDRAAQAIDTLNTRAASGIQMLASTATRVETAFDSSALDTVRTLNMPAASLAVQVADKIVQGAKAVESRVGTVSEEQEEVTTVVAKPARRVARKG